jgi:small-conductance mechanosensitive channel
MHGMPTDGRPRYSCATYNNSGGAKCAHNWIAQDELVPDVLNTIRNCILPKENDLRRVLDETLKEAGTKPERSTKVILKEQRDAQARVVDKALDAVAKAQDEAERAGLRGIYRRERARLDAMDVQTQTKKTRAPARTNQDLIEAAIEELRSLTCKLDDETDSAEVAALLRALNVRVWLKFKKVQWGKRVVHRLDRGVVCVGSAPDPDESVGEVSVATSLGMVQRQL